MSRSWDDDGEAVSFYAEMRNDTGSTWQRGLRFFVDVGSYESDLPDSHRTGIGKLCGVYQVVLFRPIKTLDKLAVPLRLITPGAQCAPTGLRLHDFGAPEEEIREAQRQAQLAKLPRLRFSGPNGLLAADRKCLEETLAALHMEGLEARKRTQDLIAYGCIEPIDGDLPVRVVEREPNAVRVLIMDGDEEGKEGWVSPQWLKSNR